MPDLRPTTSGRNIPGSRKRLVIAIASQKGGVAKTTTALSLGGALVQNNLQTLLIDLDPQANLTLSLGVNPTRLQSSIADVLYGSTQVSNPPTDTLMAIRRETAIPGLDLVPANDQLELAERFLPIRQNYESILRKALAISSISHAVILLDCPPSLGSITLNALVAADLLIIPTQSEFFSAHALKIMMDAIRRVRNQHNPRLSYRILITILDRRNRIHRELLGQIQTTFQQAVYQTVIEVDTKLRECAVAGFPISHYRPQSRGALQYNALAQEIIQSTGLSPQIQAISLTEVEAEGR